MRLINRWTLAVKAAVREAVPKIWIFGDTLFKPLVELHVDNAR